MYIPTAFKVDDREQIHRFMRTHYFATLVAHDEGHPWAVHAPVLLDVGQGEDATLIRHFPVPLISQATAPHDVWGDRCDGWRLVQDDRLSVIHERMPPHVTELRHHHRAARPFFVVLSGSATMEHGDECVELRSGEGLEIVPGMLHRIRDASERDIEFLVVSAPRRGIVCLREAREQ